MKFKLISLGMLFLLFNNGTKLYGEVREMLKLKDIRLEMPTPYSETSERYGKIIFNPGIILPFRIVSDKDEEVYTTRLLSICQLSLYENSNIPIRKKYADKVKVDMSFWDEQIPNGVEAIKGHYKKLLQFLKKKNKDEVGFHKFIFFHHLIVECSRLEKDEELDNMLYGFFKDDQVDKNYKLIIIRDKFSSDNLMTYKPLIVKYFGYKYFGDFFTFDMVFSERDEFLKIKWPYKVTTASEIAMLVDTFEQDLDHLDEFTAYNDILYVLSEIRFVNIDKIQEEIEKRENKRLKQLDLYLSILLLNNIKAAKIFLNDGNICKALKTSLLINIIDSNIQDGNYDKALQVRNELFEAMKDKSSELSFVFQFLPMHKFLLSVKELVSEIIKPENANKKQAELVEFLQNRYKELMQLKEVDKGNQIFRYLIDFYLIENAIRYRERIPAINDEAKLLIFSALNQSLENKDTYINEIAELRKNIVSAGSVRDYEKIIPEAYFTALGLITSLEIDNLIFSKIIEDKEFNKYTKFYDTIINEISQESHILKAREFYTDFKIKHIAIGIITADNVNAFDEVRADLKEILTNNPEAVGNMYGLLARSLVILNKRWADNEDIKKQAKEIENAIKRLKKN